MVEEPTRVFPVAHVNMQSVPSATTAPDAQLSDISGAEYAGTVQSAVIDHTIRKRTLNYYCCENHENNS